MAKDDPESEYRALAEEFLAHELMSETADYVQRGRRFGSLELSELSDRWISAFRDAFTNSMADRVVEMNDLAAELRLRGLDPPYDRVAAEIAKMTTDLEKIGPDSAMPNIKSAIREFLIARSKPKN
jgi:hypothetical protein